MALENIIAVGLLVLVNWKIVRNWSFLKEEMSKTMIDIASVMIAITGVCVTILDILDPLWFVPLVLFFEAGFLVFAIIYEYLKKIRKALLNPGSIDPLDI